MGCRVRLSRGLSEELHLQNNVAIRGKPLQQLIAAIQKGDVPRTLAAQLKGAMLQYSWTEHVWIFLDPA